MKTVYKFRDNFSQRPKQITKRELEARFGKDYIKRITEDAKICYSQDPLVYYELGNGISIEFK